MDQELNITVWSGIKISSFSKVKTTKAELNCFYFIVGTTFIFKGSCSTFYKKNKLLKSYTQENNPNNWIKNTKNGL